SDACNRVGEVQRRDEVIRRPKQVGRARIDLRDVQLAQACIQPGQQRVELLRKTANVEARQVCQELLNLRGHGRNLMVLRRELMELRKRCIGHDVQRDVKDTGHQTLGIQAAAKTLLDEFIQLGLAADLELLIRFGLGELLVNLNNNRHGKVVAGLIVPNQHLDDRANSHTAEFHRSAGVQAFERGIKVKDD